MSSNDSTRPGDEGRTVATDADRAERSSPEPGHEALGGSGTTPVANGRPSPAPRGDAPQAGAHRAGHEVPVQGGGPSPDDAPPAAEASSAAAPGSAEGLPPWRRVPGEQPPELDEPERPTVADSLLSEAPTAFLTAPKPAAPGAEQEAPGAGAPGAAPTATQEPLGVVGARPSSAARNRPPRQALLQLKRLDPWSVLKMALVLAGVLFLVWMVAAGVLYGVLGGMGVWDRLNGTYADLVTGQAQNSGTLISAGGVLTLAAVVGAINSLLFAVALTIVAFVYNVAADLVGGIEVTLSERD